MTEQRISERRTGIDRRKTTNRRVSERVETEWLPPYGRRKLDSSDSRQKERRVLNRRENN